jgi:hypothetical protein
MPGRGTEGPRKIITMDLNNARRLGKQPYQAVREQFDQLGERVIERHWDAGAPVRQGYRRFLGTLDELAGKLLDDDEIAQRGQDLLRENETGDAAETAGAEASDEAAGAEVGAGTGDSAGADGATGTAGAEEAAVTGAGEAGAGEADGAGASQGAPGDEAPASVWTQASGEVDRAGEAEVGEAWAAGNARLAAEDGETGESQQAPSTPTVDVVFSLPAGTEADHVALCGEFNDWSPEATSLTRGDDRAWRVTVPLAPGTYRYKFLLDGETWENGTDAGGYEENAYGTTDSVIVVS